MRTTMHDINRPNKIAWMNPQPLYVHLRGHCLFFGNKAEFKRDPDRYEIALGPIAWHCGRQVPETGAPKLIGVGETVTAAWRDLYEKLENERTVDDKDHDV